MFNESYKDIFERRGYEYDLAMNKFKNARDKEFENIIDIADLGENQTVLDIPSGGCYLSWYLSRGINLIPVETTQTFVELCEKNTGLKPVLVENIYNLPFKDRSIDRVISLAGIHHLTDLEKEKFFLEVYRILKSGGIFALADVLESTPTAKFLNEFVDKYNPMGHKGIFLTEDTAKVLSKIGFIIKKKQLRNYYWKFKTEEEMLEFCRLLFGIFEADKKTLCKGLRSYLGYIEKEYRILLNWGLFFIKAYKA